MTTKLASKMTRTNYKTNNYKIRKEFVKRGRKYSNNFHMIFGNEKNGKSQEKTFQCVVPEATKTFPKIFHRNNYLKEQTKQKQK